MKLIEYQSEFTSDYGVEYQIALRVPDLESPFTENGIIEYSGDDLIPFQRSILDLTDIEWEFEELACEAPKATSCKITFNTDLLPETILNYFENANIVSSIQFNPIPINVIIPPTYLILRKAEYIDGVFNAYKSVGIFCQQAQSESKYTNNKEFEVEYIELGKHILENIAFSEIASFLNIGVVQKKKYLDYWISDLKNSVCEIDNNDFDIDFFNIKMQLHTAIEYAFHRLEQFHLGKDFVNETINLNPVQLPIIAYKQTENHELGSQLTNNDYIFIGKIKQGTDVIGGRLSDNENAGFIKSEKNVYNYLKGLAIQYRRKLINNIDETESTVNLEPYFAAHLILTFDANHIYDYERTKKMENRFKNVATNIDNREYDIESIEKNNNLSDNSQNIEMSVVWNSRTQTTDLSKEDNIDTGLTKFKSKLGQRLTDIFYNKNEGVDLDVVRVHESIGIDLGTWYDDAMAPTQIISYNNNLTNEIQVYNPAYNFTQGTLIYSHNYAIARSMTWAALKTTPTNYYTITTNIDTITIYDPFNDVLNPFNFFGNVKASVPLYKINNELKFLVSENARYSLLSCKINSLQTGEAELTFVRVV